MSRALSGTRTLEKGINKKRSSGIIGRRSLFIIYHDKWAFCIYEIWRRKKYLLRCTEPVRFRPAPHLLHRHRALQRSPTTIVRTSLRFSFHLYAVRYSLCTRSRSFVVVSGTFGIFFFIKITFSRYRHHLRNSFASTTIFNIRTQSRCSVFRHFPRTIKMGRINATTMAWIILLAAICEYIYFATFPKTSTTLSSIFCFRIGTRAFFVRINNRSRR